jgi:hypothetical protein
MGKGCHREALVRSAFLLPLLIERCNRTGLASRRENRSNGFPKPTLRSVP